MKTKNYILVLFIFLQFSAYSQIVVTLSGCGPNSFSVVSTDVTGRNVYQDLGAFNIKWNSIASQWEIVQISPVSVWFSNSFASLPDPPCFSSGTWVTVNSGCGIISAITGTCQTTLVGINDLNTATNVTVFPNPGEGQFNFTNLENENTIEVYDLTGRMVFQTIAKNSSCSVDLSGKEKGLYCYRITDQHNKVRQGKLTIL